MVYRPARIGNEGDTDRHTFREQTPIVDALRAGIAPKEESGKDDPTPRVLAAFLRRKLREELHRLGWDLDVLRHGNEKAVNDEFVRMTGLPRPVRKDKGADPGGTGPLF